MGSVSKPERLAGWPKKKTGPSSAVMERKEISLPSKKKKGDKPNPKWREFFIFIFLLKFVFYKNICLNKNEKLYYYHQLKWYEVYYVDWAGGTIGYLYLN